MSLVRWDNDEWSVVLATNGKVAIYQRQANATDRAFVALLDRTFIEGEDEDVGSA